MLGLMQDQPLLISSLITFVERHHGDGEVVCHWQRPKHAVTRRKAQSGVRGEDSFHE